MNKIIIAIATVLILIIGGVGIYLLTAKPGSDQTASTGTSKKAYTQACDILTESIAKSILGDNIEKLGVGNGSVSTSDIEQTTCFYSTKLDPKNPNDSKTSGLQVVANIAKTSLGASDNIRNFKALTSGVDKVAGVGDDAIFSPALHQIIVLKGSNWYVVYHYVDTIINATLETDKQLAQKLTFK